MVMIHDRPEDIETRMIPGHWEGDLICGTGNKSAIGTLMERTTRFTILLHLPDRHDAGSVQEAIVKKMRHLPRLLRNSLAWDQNPGRFKMIFPTVAKLVADDGVDVAVAARVLGFTRQAFYK